MEFLASTYGQVLFAFYELGRGKGQDGYTPPPRGACAKKKCRVGLRVGGKGALQEIRRRPLYRTLGHLSRSALGQIAYGRGAARKA